MDNILTDLNEEQKEAVLHTDTPLLVLAGAGSGKTRVITYKILYLVKEKKIPLNRILAITFTNKAASEMIERVKKTLFLDDNPKWISTFHSLALKILRIEKGNNFVIYDEDDTSKVLKEVFTELNLPFDNQIIKNFKSIISEIKYNAFSEDLDFLLDIYRTKYPNIENIFNLYQKKLKENNALDFDDILLDVVNLFKENPTILKRWQNRFDYILVDEYQDTNKIQHELLKMLVGDRSCITVVGDPQQCIYTWRGAHPENILDFEKDFPNVRIIKLERNYRSTKKILEIANKVIQKSKGKWKTKVLKLWTDKIGNEDISVYKVANEKDEVIFIIKKIKEFLNKGYKYSDIAILIRMTYLSRIFEEFLLKSGIPYQIIGGVRFYERAEVKDILSYLRFSINFNDTQAFKRIINIPARGIGEKTFKYLENLKRENSINWIETLKLAFDSFNKKQKTSVQEFLDIIENIKIRNDKPYDAIRYLLRSINYEEYLKNRYPDDFLDRIQNINELERAILEAQNKGKSLDEFINDITLSQAQDSIKTDNSLKIMTIHGAKGLEFPIVFLPALEEGIFPSGKSLDNPIELEEERRLFYVGITRAKEELIMSFSLVRPNFKGKPLKTKPSRFLKDIKNDIKIKKVILKGKDNSKKNKNISKSNTNISASNNEIEVGNKVFHKVFGEGIVKELNKPFVKVYFKDVGEKKLKIEFLEKI